MGIKTLKTAPCPSHGRSGPPANIPFLDPTPLTTPNCSSIASHFSRINATNSPIGFNGPPHHFPPNYLLTSGNQHPPPTLHIFGPSRPTTPHSIDIRSAVFPQITEQRDRLTDTQTDTKKCGKRHDCTNRQLTFWQDDAACYYYFFLFFLDSYNCTACTRWIDAANCYVSVSPCSVIRVSACLYMLLQNRGRVP